MINNSIIPIDILPKLYRGVDLSELYMGFYEKYLSTPANLISATRILPPGDTLFVNYFPIESDAINNSLRLRNRRTIIVNYFPEQSKASLDSLQLEDGRTIHNINGDYFSDATLSLLHKDIRPLVSRSPSDSLFLIAGSKYTNKPEIQYSYIPEIIYLHIMGIRLGIPVVDPIIFPYEESIVKTAIRNGINSKDVHGVAGILLGSQTRGVSINNLEDLVQIGRSIIGKDAEDDLRDLTRIFKLMGQDALGDKYGDTVGKLLEISYRLSGKRFSRLIRHYNDKKNIFTFLGPDFNFERETLDFK